MDLIDIMDKFSKEKDTKFFQFARYGQSYGATDKKPARVTIQMPIDICNNKNRNLGEIDNYFGIVMFIPKEKIKEFIKKEGS